MSSCSFWEVSYHLHEISSHLLVANGYFFYYSVYKWESVLEIYSDAQIFGLKAGSSKAVSNANLAISWLEATFPELARQAAEGGNQPALKAHPYALFDASVSLQVSLLTIYSF